MITLTTTASSSPFAEHVPLAFWEQPPRFTRDGSDSLEWHIARTCDVVLAGVQKIVPSRKLEALMLGGGYGRGEGGVLKTGTGDRPYNDLELYVCVRGNRFFNRWRYEPALHELAESLSPAAGVEVEFKVISLDHLRGAPITMFYYDLVLGHRWLWGGDELLHGCEHHREARAIPLSEATRLLMNRCSGLLFALERLERQPFTVEDTDFVGRNLAKAQLAFGDAVLTVFGQYHWSCLERHERLRRLNVLECDPWLADVRRHHSAGVRFKLHPYRTRASLAVLRAQYEELRALAFSVWLWLENRRLGLRFQSARDYAMSPANKYSGSNPWRNLLLSLKAFGPAAFFSRAATRAPQERLLNALALLLWEPWRSDPQLTWRLQDELGIRRGTRQDLTRVYRRLWAQFN